jgi:hypothetical protein
MRLTGTLLALAEVVLAVLFGCASNTYVWQKPEGVTENQFYGDRAQCLALARSGGSAAPQIAVNPMKPAGNDPFSKGVATGYNNYSAAYANAYNQAAANRVLAEQDQIFMDCMRSKGYRYELADWTKPTPTFEQ